MQIFSCCVTVGYVLEPVPKSGTLYDVWVDHVAILTQDMGPTRI